MNITTRPNVRWQSHGAGASTVSAMNRRQWDAPANEIDRAINRRAYAVTGLIVTGLIAILTNLDRLPEFWGGFTAGVLTLCGLGLLALAVGVFLGGAWCEPPAPTTPDRGAHR